MKEEYSYIQSERADRIMRTIPELWSEERAMLFARGKLPYNEYAYTDEGARRMKQMMVLYRLHGWDVTTIGFTRGMIVNMLRMYIRETRDQRRAKRDHSETG